VHSAIQKVIDRAGRIIDALINNAGYTLIGALEETRELFDTNVFGVLRMNQVVLPMMRK